MSIKTTLNWNEEMSFDVEVNGFHLTLDADPKYGGKEKGPRPKPLLLAALSGCGAMDVVSMINKMKMGEYTLNIETEADATESDPIIYHTIRLKYHLTGSELIPAKVIRAIELSRDKYCGVYAMLAKAAEIHISLFINNEEVWNG